MHDRKLHRNFQRFRQQDDFEALTLVFDATSPALLGLARHLIQPRHGAEDVLQATFVTAIEQADRWDSARPLYPWLAGILVNKARRWNERESRVIVPEDLPERSGEADPALTAGRLELGVVLRRALAGMPESYRNVLEPWLEQGLGPASIANELGLAPGAVRVRLHRGLKRLRRVLPPGLAYGAGADLLSSKSLAAVREAVARAARVHAAPLNLGSTATGGLSMMSLLPTVPLLILSLVSGTASTVFVATHYPGAQADARQPGPGRDRGQPRSEAVSGAEQAQPEQAQPESAPTLLRPAPSTVVLSGGPTTIGARVEQITELVTGLAQATQLVRSLDAETPQHSTQVDPFCLGVTEVTQEQYAAFVQATGQRPPSAWGSESIDVARRSFLEQADGATPGSAKAAGLFDAEAWWDVNWSSSPWGIPEGDERRPVVGVSYEDARLYATWSGGRLPTEVEYQHAVRGGGDAPYPWGQGWPSSQLAATSELGGTSKPFPVGSFPAGRSPQGLMDLAGNVWEWTSSPYGALPGFEPNRYPLDGSTAEGDLAPQPRWNLEQAVVVGGSYQNSKIAARCTVRRGTERSQRAGALGFRVAVTPRVAHDAAASAASLAQGITYDLDRLVAMDRWSVQEQDSEGPTGYAVVTGYEHLALAPVASLEANTDRELREETLHAGLLSTTVPLTVPPLEAGAYQLLLQPGRNGHQVRWVDLRTGEAVATTPCATPRLAPDDGTSELVRRVDRVSLETRVPTRDGGQALALRLELEIAADQLAHPWNE